MRHSEGADPRSRAVFDALTAAKARGADVVICDTAGRLHNKTNLMNELAKIDRVIDRELPGADRETLLVLDAATGQNALISGRAIQPGRPPDRPGASPSWTARPRGASPSTFPPGLGVPVKFIGVGEQADDLLEFDAGQFVRAFFE